MAEMNEQRARDILGKNDGSFNPPFGAIKADGSLDDIGRYLSWSPGDDGVSLDGDFTAEELEAVAWWMRNAANLSCATCGDSGWAPNVDANGERVWLPLMNDAVPCKCGALARNYAAQRERIARTARRWWQFWRRA